MFNLPKKAKNESDHRFNVRTAKVKSQYNNIKKFYDDNGVRIPSQEKDESARKYVDRLIRQYRSRAQKTKLEKWVVTVEIYYRKLNSGDVYSYSTIYEFNHNPSQEELQEVYNETKFDLENSTSYDVIVYEQQNKIIQEPIHLIQNNIRHIVMKQNINKNCVIELLHMRYNTPIDELESFFLGNTTPEKIDEWCTKNDVPHYAFDLCNNRLFKPSVKQSKKRALIYVASDEHINEINNIKHRNQLLKVSKPNTKKKKTIKQRPEIPELKLKFTPISSIDYFTNDKKLYNKLMKLSGTYYTTNNLLYLFLLITYNERRPPNAFSSVDTIYQLKHKNFKITYCTQEQLDLHNSLDIPFTGSNIKDLVYKHMDVQINKLESKYNKQTYDIIQNVSVSPLHYNYKDISKDELNKLNESKQLLEFDIKRCYPNICVNYNMPYLTSDQLFDRFDGTPKPNYWYVVSSLGYEIALGRCRFIPYDLLQYCNNITIDYQILPNYTPVLKEKYIELSKDPKYKLLGNMFIGLLSRTNKKKSNIIYTYSKDEIGYYAYLLEANVKYLDFNNKRLYHTIPQLKIDIDQFKYRMAYLQITMMSRVLCMKMLAEIKNSLKNFIPLRINTDGVLGILRKKQTVNIESDWYRRKPLSEFIADINKTIEFELSELPRIKEPKLKKIIFNDKWDPNEVANKILELNGGRINGCPGTGKTHLLTTIQNKLPVESTITTTYTRLASSLIPNSKSLHEVFGIKTIENFDVSDDILRFFDKNITHILIDECSMISEPIYETLSLVKSINNSIKIFLFGDDNQFKPIKSKPITHTDPLMKFLTDGNEIILNYQFRSNDKYIDKLLNGDYSDVKPSVELTKFNIALTNETCDYVNKICEKKYGSFDKNGCYIRFDKTTHINKQVIPKNLLCEVFIDKQYVYLTQIFNGRLDLCLEFKLTTIDYVNLISNKNIKLGYCITAYKSQGITINEPYIIHDWDHYHMNKTAKYVAASRTTSVCYYKKCVEYDELQPVDYTKMLEKLKGLYYKYSVIKRTKLTIVI